MKEAGKTFEVKEEVVRTKYFMTIEIKEDNYVFEKVHMILILEEEKKSAQRKFER